METNKYGLSAHSFQAVEETGSKRAVLWARCSELCNWGLFRDTGLFCYAGQIVDLWLQDVSAERLEEEAPLIFAWWWAKYITDLELVVTEHDRQSLEFALDQIVDFWGLKYPSNSQLVSLRLKESALRSAVAGSGPMAEALRQESWAGKQEWTFANLFACGLKTILKEEPYYA